MLVRILKAIYADSALRTLLGFKGGTAAYLFYDLPRFSVDLDFDLLDAEKKEVVLERLTEVLPQFGKLKEATEKRFNLFLLLSYGLRERNVKVEISKRAESAKFAVKQYLGIPILLMTKEDMIAGKLSALLTRKKFASRDLFDLWFFLGKEWEINESVVEEKTGFTLKEALKQAIEKVEGAKSRYLLQGMGELLDERQKIWVKTSLKDELLFRLRLYLETL